MEPKEYFYHAGKKLTGLGGSDLVLIMCLGIN